ncbi:MAG: adenylyltransferase/cytidyltransferase family protein [Lachnospiraceae bacterium]|nr:adenylyltransferase/cytidyltransferase family protein [Lachnospiraceae bacterium]
MSKIYGLEEKTLKFKDHEIEWLELIKKNSEKEMNNLVENTKDWKLFYHFSNMRNSVLSWYEFRENADILEIGGGYGEITGLLCDRARSVTTMETYSEKAYIINERYKDRDNLTVLVGDIENYDSKEKYDYIVLFGCLGYKCGGSKDIKSYAEYLKSIYKYLKENGIIIVVTDNKLGIEKLCGKPAVSTGIPFDTLMNYTNGSKYYSFSKEELIAIGRESECKKIKFYYPVPDHIYTQEVYTDSYMPNAKLTERMVNYYLYSSTAVADERILFKDIIKNGVFSVFSNSFIMELSIDGNLNEVIYATVTSDREVTHSFTTVLKENGYAKKTPIHPEGNEKLIEIYENHNNLKEKNIPVIEQKIKDNSIVMPYVKEKTLSEYLCSAKLEKKELFEIFDKLYNYIIRTSEHVCVCDEEFGCYSNSMGVVLKNAYIDMIPFNCFYLESGEFMFFDQEFLKHNCPAGYIMYRAIMYTYCFAEEMEVIAPIDEMKERYKLKEMWEIYERCEKNFVRKNRRYDNNLPFWKSTSISVENIEDNKKRLLGKTLKFQVTDSGEEGEKEYALGYIAGVFDLFHIGHLNLIKNAKSKCNRLIVGVLTDELVEHFKGKKPYISTEERMEIIGATKYVDAVVKVDFSNIDKIDAWKLYHFDCLFSGDDWKDSPKWLEDREKLRELGSDIHFFDYTKSTSSTHIKNLIKERRI